MCQVSTAWRPQSPCVPVRNKYTKYNMSHLNFIRAAFFRSTSADPIISFLLSIHFLSHALSSHQHRSKCRPRTASASALFARRKPTCWSLRPPTRHSAKKTRRPRRRSPRRRLRMQAPLPLQHHRPARRHRRRRRLLLQRQPSRNRRRRFDSPRRRRTCCSIRD